MQKGFIFIETIITIVILTGSLLFLYQTFNNTLQNEKARIYYDDTPYIYRTYYLKDNIVKLNIDNILLMKL